MLLFSHSLFLQASSPEQMLKALSLREKIGQLFFVAAASCFDQPTEQLASSMKACPYKMDPEYIAFLIKEYKVGGVIFLYKSSPELHKEFVEHFQSLSEIPLFIVLDAEWGVDMRLSLDPSKVVRYPRALTLGAIQEDQIIYDVAYEIGVECASLGIDMNLAPVLDCNTNKHNPVIHMRSFGDDPQKVFRCAKLFQQGLHAAGVLSCAKHYCGHGDTAVDSHTGLPVIEHEIDRLYSIEILPFKMLIENGLDAVMTGHLVVPALDASRTPVSMSYKLSTTLLKEELGFSGLVITDGLGMEALYKYAPGERELVALKAGNDIVLCPLDVPRAVALIEDALIKGELSQDWLNEKVLKILQYKARKTQKNIKSQDSSFLVRAEAYNVQKKAYRAAITVCGPKDNGVDLTAVCENGTVIQIGSLPDNRFAQLCAERGKKLVCFERDMSREDVAACCAKLEQEQNIVVAFGDMHTKASDSFGITHNARLLVDSLCLLGKQVTVVLFGTPYSAELFYKNYNCIIAYEDLSVVQEAVCDVLCGMLKPEGKLPVLLN